MVLILFHYDILIFFQKINNNNVTIIINPQDKWLRNGSTMIFCRDVASATAVYDRLRKMIQQGQTKCWDGLHLWHEELDSQNIQTILGDLRQQHMGSSSTTITKQTDPVRMIVCTDLAARGLDVPNIRHVILYDVPTTVSSFVHQVGRTARKGQNGVLTSLVHTANGGDAQKYTHLHALKGASDLFS